VKTLEDLTFFHEKVGYLLLSWHNCNLYDCI